MKISVDDSHTVSGIASISARASACCVLAHGAGAGMTHPFMGAIADGLLEHDIASLRYQFPYMEQGSSAPIDRPSRRPPSERRSMPRRAQCLDCRCLRAANPSAAG